MGEPTRVNITANGIDYGDLARAAFDMARPRHPFEGSDSQWGSLTDEEQHRLVLFARSAVEVFLRSKRRPEEV